MLSYVIIITSFPGFCLSIDLYCFIGQNLRTIIMSLKTWKQLTTYIMGIKIIGLFVDNVFIFQIFGA